MNKLHRDARRGVTILEVLFATGIAITGLLGIASVLLMSGRDASVANTTSVAQALSQDWYAEFMTRGYNQPSNWVMYQDYAYSDPGPPVVNYPPGSYLGGKMLPGPVRPNNSLPVDSPIFTVPDGKFSVCIDPAFYSDRTIAANLVALSGSTDHWYRPAVFPYYQHGYNPLTDSDHAHTATSGIAWSDQPRMLRASVASTPGLAAALSEKQVQNLFQSQDELALLGEQEIETLGLDLLPAPPIRRYQPLLDGSNGKPSVQAQYSWMATLSPLVESNVSTESHYTLSLVVMHQRDRLFIDPATFVSRSGPVGSTEDKPQGERLVWVTPQSGDFVGGNGGRVQLTGSIAVDDRVSVGDWIMLSKHVSATQISTSPVVYQPFSVFRWYRVIGVDGDATEVLPAAAGVDPYGNAPPETVWTRSVVLEGPDWRFFNPVTGTETISVPPSGAVLPTPTTATLVKGAVSVYERIVEVPDFSAF